jgi:hypothetical protein
MEMDRCRDLREHLVAWMAGTASKEVELRVRLHLSDGCAGCARELEALYEAFHAVPLASPPQPLPEGSVPLLVKKIAAQPQEVREVPIVYPETDGRRLAWVLVFLFGVALVAAAVWGRHQVRELDEAAGRVAFEEAQTRRVSGEFHDLRSRAGRIEAHLLALTDPQTSSHDFHPGKDDARLRAFVRLDRGMLVLAFADIPAPAEGQQHVVWWLQGDAWTQVGVVPADRTGGITFPLPEGATLPTRLQVTTETPSGPPPERPMGEVVLSGELLPGQPWAAGAAEQMSRP